MEPGITAHMAEALAFTHEHGELVRFAGGYWSYKGVTFETSKFARGSVRKRPVQFVGESTVAALLKRGKLRAVQTNGVRGDKPVKVQLAESEKESRA